ncbi:MAG: aldehyde dehydrogenase family protein [Sandaracinaceae bacterium]|nr:aldehyde dehydrogenase family protein [Sandaracinaceae bacterium]
MRERYPFYVANVAESPNADLEVTNKYTGEVVTRVALARAADIERAIVGAVAAQDAMRRMPPFERKAVLEHCVRRFRERFEELAMALCLEAGKPIKDARGEVTRLIDTFTVAAEEATRLGGEVVPLQISSRAKGYRGMTQRVPVGPCSLIAPFNFPLNLAAHKIAPAIAAGCTWVLKPASKTPVGALMIGEILAETSLPKGSFSILPVHRDGADLFTTDPRFKLLSFTGSPQVGWDLKARAGKKKVVLELGGNAACIVDRDADLDVAVPRIVFGAFYQSGQSCISVQRVIVHDAIYEAFRVRFVDAVRALVAGDPRDESTFLGPMISEGEAERLQGWIEDAKARGATILCGGSRAGAMLEATVVEGCPREAPLYREEAFGPVALLSRFETMDEAFAEVNDSAFGLQAGLFTNDLPTAMRAWDELEVGGVLVNEVPSFRVDNMPYGGVKDSGLGREGVRYAIEDMTEPRLLVLKS